MVWTPGMLNRVVNVHWASDVIVVFSFIDSLTVTSDKAQLLDTRVLTFEDVQPVTAYFVKVTANLDDAFVKTTRSSDELAGFGVAVAMVCALTDNDDDSLTAAETIAKKWIYQNIQMPSGCLWIAELLNTGPGQAINWKITDTEHRHDPPDDSSLPPNQMVQCFPLDITPTTIVISNDVDTVTLTYSGFNVLTYRLDADGTDTAYDCPPEWKNDIVLGIVSSIFGDEGGNHGQKFANELPLIAADVPL